MYPSYPGSYPYYGAWRRPAKPERSRPATLIVAAILAMLSGVAVLVAGTLVTVRTSQSIPLLLLAYIPASVTVLAPIFMLMGYRWAYSLTVSALAGQVLLVVLSLVPTELVLLPGFIFLLAIAAFVLAPVWISLWLLMTEKVERIFEGPRKFQLSVYYNEGEEEPPMEDPKEIPETVVVYVPAAPSYGYWGTPVPLAPTAGYSGYPGYGGYPSYPGYSSYLAYPTYPGDPSYPSHPGYPRY